MNISSKFSIYMPPLASIDWFQNKYDVADKNTQKAHNKAFSFSNNINDILLSIKKNTNKALTAKTAEKILPLNASLATGKNKNIFSASIYRGYPGGWPMDSVKELAIVSGESLFLKAGYVV